MSQEQREGRGRFVSLRIKFLIAVTVIFTIVYAAAFYWFYTFATNQAMNRIQEDMIDTLEGTIAGIDVDEFVAMAREAEPREDGLTDDPRYWEHLDWLARVQAVEPRANPYTYIKGDEPNEVLFIGDILVTMGRGDAAGFREPYVSQGGMWQGLSGLNIKLEPYSDPWGRWVSAYSPIVNEASEVVGAVGLDFRADYVDQVRQGILDKVGIAFLATYAILFLLAWGISGTLTRSIITLTAAAERLGEGNYEQDMSKLVAHRFPDEMATLARVFEDMASKVRQREEDLKKQVAQLRIQVDEAKRQQQVREIVDTEFFQSLRSKADAMRRRPDRAARQYGDPGARIEPQKDANPLKHAISQLDEINGVIPTDLTTLPDTLAPVVRKMMVEGTMPLSEFAGELRVTQEEAREIGSLLVTKGFLRVKEDQEHGEPLYQVHLAHTRPRNIPADLL
ncbi:MAG: HAMP domain-containing protein [Chloroflexota bacterium]|nr:HAMP domain-containing protein [Chloroflexota bacterium]